MHARTHEANSPILDRCLDLAIALMAVIVCFPALVMVTLAIALERKGPALFKHVRIYRSRRVKFRRMRVNGH